MTLPDPRMGDWDRHAGAFGRSQLVRLREILGRHILVPPQRHYHPRVQPPPDLGQPARAAPWARLQGAELRGPGPQPLGPAAIGRINSLELVRDVCGNARDAGFDTISLDLIYGLPEQTEGSFLQTLEEVVDIAPDRVRCYSYSHRPTVRPHQYAIECADLPRPEEKLSLLHEAVDCFTSAGYHWIGADCFVRPGDELAVAQSAKRLRHNCIGYTTSSAQHLIAVGMSALGEVDGAFVQNESALKPWSAALEAGTLPVAWGHRLSEGDLRRRQALQHLMCNLELPATFAKGLEEDYERLCDCSEHGLVEVDSDRIRITPRGRYFLRSLCSQHALSVAWNSNQWGVPQIA